MLDSQPAPPGGLSIVLAAKSLLKTGKKNEKSRKGHRLGRLKRKTSRNGRLHVAKSGVARSGQKEVLIGPKRNPFPDRLEILMIMEVQNLQNVLQQNLHLEKRDQSKSGLFFDHFNFILGSIFDITGSKSKFCSLARLRMKSLIFSEVV